MDAARPNELADYCQACGMLVADRELRAVAATIAALVPLDHTERGRALKYCMQRMVLEPLRREMESLPAQRSSVCGDDQP